MPVELPKVLESILVSGTAQVMPFRTLNESMRKANVNRSVMWNPFTREASILNMPGPVSPE